MNDRACNCPSTDAWRCAKETSSPNVACYCRCHYPENNTVECQFCGLATTKIETRMCDGCWEVHSGIRSMPIRVLNKIVKSARSPEYYVPKEKRK